MKTSRYFAILTAVIFCAAISSPNAALAQVTPTAFRSPISLSVGGEISGFDPRYGPNKLLGIGAYADLNLLPHGIGIEGEARWQRFHSIDSIAQDNYLIGPRVKILHFWRAQPYVKVLAGFSNMNFGEGIGTGRFTTLSYGGGLDIKLTRRISLRAIDVEYQQWPSFFGTSLYPYGGNVGVSYRIF